MVKESDGFEWKESKREREIQGGKESGQWEQKSSKISALKGHQKEEKKNITNLNRKKERENIGKKCKKNMHIAGWMGGSKSKIVKK